jgi:hypothetical protein
MVALLCFFLTLFASPFKSKSRLEAENSALRHQLIVLQRRVSGRVKLTNGDRLFLEPISKSPEEDKEAGELNKAQEVLGVVLPADEDSALPLDPGEEALNDPAAHIAG